MRENVLRGPSVLLTTVLIATLLLSAFSFGPSGCDRGTVATYDVTVAPNDTTGVSIRLTLSGVPRDSLSVVGYAPTGTIRLSGFRIDGMERARVVAGVDTIDTDGRPVVRPRFELLGPLPTTVVMQYRVRPGVREGDSHIGFTGRCLGYQGADLVFATGRQLFLLPRLHINRTEVRFHLPPGWTVAAPWARAGNIWHPGIGGSYQAEHLVSAALGLGRFHER